MDKKTLAFQIKNTSLLKGDFVLRSGLSSHEYFDKYQFESRPQLLKAVCAHLQELIPPDTQILAGLTMGGIPLAVGLALETQIPCVFVRKTAKTYGTKKITEGPAVKGQKVCLVEDVITTGGQVIKSTKAMRKEGAIVENVICVIHRGEAEAKAHLQKTARLTLHALFTRQDFS